MLAFIFIIEVAVTRFVWWTIFCDGACTSSPRAVMGVMTGNAACNGRVLSVAAKQIIETGEQLILSVEECRRLIAQDKQNEDGQWPIVLHYTNRHYSAFIHRRKACQANASDSSTCPDAKILGESTCSDVVMSDVGAILFTERVSANEGAYERKSL